MNATELQRDRSRTANGGSLKRVVRWLTRGLPMARGKYLFHDRVMNRDVYSYRCKNNKLWMATGRLDLMRVPFY